MTDTETLDLVGTAEAARIVGVTPQAIQQAHWRGRMPPPIPVAGSVALVWRRADVERWAADRPGRGRPADADP